MSRGSVYACCFALLGVAVFAIAQVVVDAPAFNTSKRLEGVFGDWRVRPGAALYDRSEYYLQLGYGYLNAQGFGPTTTGPTPADGTDDDALAQTDAMTKAATLLEDSVALAPGNAHAWAWLAWAYAAQGDLPASSDAMEASWRLAPHNLDLALTRLTYFEAIKSAAPEDGSEEESDVTRSGVRRDLETLAKLRRRTFEAAMTNSQVLRRYRPDV